MEIQFTLDEIGGAARQIIQAASNKTLCLYGEMGAGKTTLIKALVKELGGADQANSPTFGIVNEYHKKDGSLLGYHFDFYRLEDEAEALDLGLEDYLNRGVWIFMEWPEKIKSFLPLKTTNVQIEILDLNSRKLRLG
ncbi:MAG: tRNA (adenosine(37)-N6)-threonylcarbamoyltransferase complex ATPase subunit type 1 TsaE [Aurantibacter sp.]